VKQFQTDKKLPVTGTVDAATWNALLATPSTSGATTTTAP
jgi:peptidoglycan hydrolase-like protein with peptidoglycan-binding domain